MTGQAGSEGQGTAAFPGPATNGSGPAHPGGAGSPAVVAEQVEQLRTSAREMIDSARKMFGQDELIGRVDPAAFSIALARFGASMAANPVPAARVTWHYAQQAGMAWVAAGLRAFGFEMEGPAALPKKDPRFSDPAWTENAGFYLLRQLYTLAESYARDLLDDTRLDAQTREKARFALGQVLAAAAPTNFPALNPKVLKRTFETGGQSVLRGLRNVLRDTATNSGRPRQLVPGEFVLGENLAATPGKVVYSNRLIELIQFKPQTEQVYATPLLLSPPWINKYYIMDLAPQRSLIEWAVQHGHTCFVISYRNPDESMRDVGMSDYLREGLLAAMDVVSEITGAPKINLVGLCLGGTLATMLTAWLAARGEDRVNSLTLLNTLLDFSMPGELGVLTDEQTIDRLEKTMGQQGYLPADSMRNTFDLLRANDLLWNYVVNDWLLGEEPKSFDILSWNSDSTRMPARMHTEYLRSCYLENRLAHGRMELAGEKLDLARVTQDTYAVSAENDHIAPWKSSYEGIRNIGGPVRFALSNAGHIAGVVNPPSSKSKHWVVTKQDLPADPTVWREGAYEVAASWWEDWTEWIAQRAGEQVSPPSVGSSKYPATDDAPGSYVLEK